MSHKKEVLYYIIWGWEESPSLPYEVNSIVAQHELTDPSLVGYEIISGPHKNEEQAESALDDILDRQMGERVEEEFDYAEWKETMRNRRSKNIRQGKLAAQRNREVGW